jgi:hypothetical protein
MSKGREALLIWLSINVRKLRCIINPNTFHSSFVVCSRSVLLQFVHTLRALWLEKECCSSVSNQVQQSKSSPSPFHACILGFFIQINRGCNTWPNLPIRYFDRDPGGPWQRQKFRQHPETTDRGWKWVGTHFENRMFRTFQFSPNLTPSSNPNLAPTWPNWGRSWDSSWGLMCQLISLRPTWVGIKLAFSRIQGVLSKVGARNRVPSWGQVGSQIMGLGTIWHPTSKLAQFQVPTSSQVGVKIGPQVGMCETP